MPEINTSNSQMVGVKGEMIVIISPKNLLTKEEALTHAAWLIVLAEGEDKIQDYIKAICK